MKVVGMLFALNEREFIKEQLDNIMKIVDVLVIRMGNMSNTIWFTPNNNSTDGTKELIEEYIKDKPNIHFDSGLWYGGGFDEMKPSGFKRASEFCDDGDIIMEFCSNEFYFVDKIKSALKLIGEGKLTGDVFTVEFRHLYKLMRWSFIMGREHRVVRYRKGMQMEGQSWVVLNGQKLSPYNLDINCFHLCPLKATGNIWNYIRKYTGYSMRGRNASVPELQDIKWALDILYSEGYLVPNEFVELEMQRVGGAYMATQYLGPFPDDIVNHPRWKPEVYDYYTSKGYTLQNGVFCPK